MTHHRPIEVFSGDGSCLSPFYLKALKLHSSVVHFYSALVITLL